MAAKLRNVTKYRNIRTEYRGVKYASRREADYAAELDLRLRAGDIKGWRRQVRIPLHVHGKHIADYICDFEIQHKNGELEYAEVKGHATDTFLLKWKLFEACWPGLRKQIVR